ncbi:MAG TPA: rRNA maturation RNase YbeY [Acholeplasmataceae bacterium]|nr:rRNA maturation RNase YbeY [Acholeplasmataceae bacterium]
MKVNYFNQQAMDTAPYELILDKVFETIDETKTMQIIFVDNDTIQQINQMYRQKNQPTDVLSFVNDEEQDDSLGDIFISIDKAQEQAKTYGHSLKREIGFLAVHGYLHLKGYDHETKAQEEVMFKLQEDILLKANLTR